MRVVLDRKASENFLPSKWSIFLKNAAIDKRFMGRSEIEVLLKIIRLVQVK